MMWDHLPCVCTTLLLTVRYCVCVCVCSATIEICEIRIYDDRRKKSDYYYVTNEETEITRRANRYRFVRRSDESYSHELLSKHIDH